jgi:hypothetical protein
MEAATIQNVIVSRQGIKGLKGIRMGSFGAPSINDSGSVAVYATIYGKGIDASSNTAIVLLNRTGNARKIIQEGDDFNFTSFGTAPLINNSRHIAFDAEREVFVLKDGKVVLTTVVVVGLGNPSGSWAAYPGSSLLSDLTTFSLNSRNATALTAGVQQGDTVYRLTRARSFPLVAAGDVPIGLPLSSTYSSFGAPGIDDKNNIYYVADISDAGNAFDGIWFGKNGDPQPLVIKGQDALNGSAFSSFLDSPSPSPDGSICAFTASAGGTNNGVWTVNTRSKVVTPVVTTSSLVDGSSERLSNFQSPAVNKNGQLAFLATSSATKKTGIYAWDGSKLVKVIAPGDSMNINGKDKNVIDIRFNPMRGLNSKGIVVFTASFDDRTSGVFKAGL